MDSDLLFRLGTLVALVTSAVWLWRRHRDSFGNPASVGQGMLLDARATFSDLGGRRGLTTAGVVASVRMLSYALAVASTAVLAVTGLIPYLALGGPLSGLALVIYVTTAPVFAVSVTVACLLWGEAHVFTRRDSRAALARKSCFWVLLVSAPVVIGSILLSMYPAFGTVGQRALLAAHLVGTTVFLVVGTYHALLVAEAAERQDATEHESSDGNREETAESRGYE